MSSLQDLLGSLELGDLLELILDLLS